MGFQLIFAIYFAVDCFFLYFFIFIFWSLASVLEVFEPECVCLLYCFSGSRSSEEGTGTGKAT